MHGSDRLQPLISVVVCTYNRAGLLEGCLRSLMAQGADPALYEVLVVDNNSRDHTADVVSRFASRPVRVTRVPEPAQGLSFSRNTGWKSASGRYVAYIDDDAAARPDWVAAIVDFIGRRPEVGIVGGPYRPFFLTPPPHWFPPDYGSLDLGAKERPLRLEQEWISGSNMIFKRELFHLYGGFNERLGMKGDCPAYGEEVHLLLAMGGAGVLVYYAPTIQVEHLVAEYKMRLSWLFRSDFAAGKGHQAIFGTKSSPVGLALTLALCLMKGCCNLLRPSALPWKRRLYYNFRSICYLAGQLVGVWRELSGKGSP